MRVYRGDKEVRVSSINWSSLSGAYFPYSIKQMPGDDNALGRVKFMFPNPYNVYLHDTPTKSKFETPERSYSHGCIRLHDPMQLAYYLFRDDPKHTPADLDAIVATGRNNQVRLKSPIPIYLTYFTTWVDAEGILHFQKDIYEQDPPIMERL